MTVQEQNKTVKLPKKVIHNMFGVCWDKTNTYTIVELSKEDFNNKAITPNSVLKLANIQNFEEEFKNKITIIFSSGEATALFNLTENKKVDSYEFSYRKGNVLDDLKQAENIIVIQADRSSLRLPKYNNSRDLNFYSSSKFNEDSSLYERIKFTETSQETWDNELKEWKKVPLSDNDIRQWSTSCEVEVHIINSNKNFRLRKTLGSLRNQQWGELIDKSGYNRNARLVANRVKLQEFKANKVREDIKNGNLIAIRANITMLLNQLKYEVSMLLNRSNLNNIKFAENYLLNLVDYRNRFNGIEERISKVGSDAEYTPYTMTIKDDLNKIKEELVQLIKDVRTK